MLEITQAEIVGRLQFDNPWWDAADEGRVQYADKPRRNYFPSFLASVQDKSIQRAVVLMGPRRVGKTVMVYHAIDALIAAGTPCRNILYLSLETPIYTGLSLERIVNYFRELFQHKREANLFIFFDEVQYLKNWEIHLKSLVDSYPNYKFVATGSAAAALRLKSNESGAGRFSDYILPPLTFAEYLRFIGKEDTLITVQQKEGETDLSYSAKNIDLLNEEFIRYLNFGGYPEAVFSDTVRANPSQYIKSDIIDKVLLRDLPSLYGINDIQELNRLFTVLAYNTSNEVSLENLSKASGVAKNTIKRYLEYLEAAFLIRCVNRIDQNAQRFKRAVSFKVYLTNPSMRAALFGEVNADSSAMGALAETAVFSQWEHQRKFNIGDIYYARWKSGEVDLVYLDNKLQQPCWAVEVKWSDRPYSWHQELDNCVEFVQQNRSITQPILITSRNIHQQGLIYNDVSFNFTPTSVYTYTVGKNLLQQI